MNRLEKLLQRVKDRRNFVTSTYVENKIVKLTEFFSFYKIDAVVVPISGGIDSAVVLALMHALLKKNVLKQVLPIFIPIYHCGTTGQNEAEERSRELCDRFDFSFHKVDATDATLSMIHNSLEVMNTERRKWAEGQLASIVRTPIIYYHAAVLQTEGFRSIVVGTTNKSEGAFIGFYGKASDGMNDLQPIADIYKSEVYEIGRYFDIPESIMNEKPRGDVWDGRNDEEMIGAPYWFLELFMEMLDDPESDVLFELDVDEKMQKQVDDWIMNIIALHVVNEHKYQVGHPAHFVDVMPRNITGGWNNKSWKKPIL